ncbi:MAG: hypothetical protein DI589_02200 [Shinella sp.]|nr:MAG: hypothetical protein DI589_02200 [Shinella sp.]
MSLPFETDGLQAGSIAMAIRFERPVSRSAFWAKRLGFMALVLFVIVFVAGRFGGLSVPDFAALLLVAAALAAVAVLLALLGLAQLWRVGALGGLAAFAGLVFAALPLGVAGVAVAAYMTSPPVFDLSTDPADPPPFLKPRAGDQQWLPRAATPNGEWQAAGAYVDLVGRRFDGAPDRLTAAVRKAARAVRMSIVATEGEALAGSADAAPAAAPTGKGGGNPAIPIPLPRPEPQLLSAPPVLIGKPGDVLIQGVTRTLVFGMPFDIMIRLREEDDNTLVDVRAVARYGDRDFGIGAELIRAFLDALEAEMLGLG